MKSTCTALMLALALLAMRFIVHDPAPLRRDPHSRASALLHGAIDAYRHAIRHDGSRVQRADKASADLAAPHAALQLARPDRVAIVSTAAASSLHDVRARRREHARAPPRS